MMTGNRTVTLWFVLGLGVVCAFLALGGSLVLVRAAALDLPPRPSTPTPQPAPKPRARVEPVGGWIELYVPVSGPWASRPWQGLWTMVQWQDTQGRWHDVEGWGGSLDAVESGAGKKTWWVAESDFGTSPFRWIVDDASTGERIGTSEPFALPQADGEMLPVEVKLVP